MHVTVNFECTPEEARSFLGLPDVKPMQDAILKKLEERMTHSLGLMDPEALFKSWLPMQFSNLEQLQKLFWQFASGKRGEKAE
jgi:hypothetical protein